MRTRRDRFRIVFGLLLTAGLCVLAAGQGLDPAKLLKPAAVAEGFVKLGYDESLALGIGLTELACTVLYVVPRTSVLGAILLTGYLGGATATHVRLGEAFFAPIVLGVLVWLGTYLRDVRLRGLIPLRNSHEAQPSARGA